MKNRTPQKQQLVIIAALLLWCSVLLAWQIHLAASSEKTAVGLWWNLFLACIPLAASSAFCSASQRKGFAAFGWFALWILFLPNAPYLLTDLIHLKPHARVPEWFLLALLLSCAGTGTFLGYFSLLNVQAEIARRKGARAGWLLAICACILCGFGIYLGRFLRWNSWNALTHPLALAREIVERLRDSGPHPHPLAVTLVYGIGLFLGYLAIRVAAESARETAI